MATPYTPELAELVKAAQTARDYLAEVAECEDDSEELDRVAVLLQELEGALEPFES